MPYAPARPCAIRDCPNLTVNVPRYCDYHLKQIEQIPRQSSSQRGYDSRWQKARHIYLREHPLCVACRAEGRLTPATTVDHIISHHGNYDLMWNESNWQALCNRHHSIKTATQDGAFGNRETR